MLLDFEEKKMCNSLTELLSARAHTVALLGIKICSLLGGDEGGKGGEHISLLDGG